MDFEKQVQKMIVEEFVKMFDDVKKEMNQAIDELQAQINDIRFNARIIPALECWKSISGFDH